MLLTSATQVIVFVVSMPTEGFIYPWVHWFMCDHLHFVTKVLAIDFQKRKLCGGKVKLYFKA